MIATDARQRVAKNLVVFPHGQHSHCRTSKMSHGRGRRAACGKTIRIRWLHFETLSAARGVTDMVVGSGALLAAWPLDGLAWKPRLIGKTSGIRRWNFSQHPHQDARRFSSPRSSEARLCSQTDFSLIGAWQLFWLTSKMSHDRGWRAACNMPAWIPEFRFEIHE